MGQFRLSISTMTIFNMKTILALFGFFLPARALSGRQLKSCIDGCPVANRYRACVSNCLSSQQQGGVQNCQGQRCNQNNPGGGQFQNQNNQKPFGGINSQQGGVQNCQGQRCFQNNQGGGGQFQNQNNQKPFGGIVNQQGGVQNCQGQRCNQNNPGGSSVSFG